MKLYHRLTQGIFLQRPNRFIALCEVRGERVVCHVKNTGRCRELLLPGSPVWLEESDNPSRKTRYDLVCVENRGYTVNMDSQAPNLVFGEWLASGRCLTGVRAIRPESRYGDSRFDFSYERQGAEGESIRGFAEVKGVTLFDDAGAAYFPDAPTERGVKHVRELIAAHRAGYEAMICFVLQRENVLCLRPNDRTHPAFGDALREAAAAGVLLTAVCCSVTPDSCAAHHTVPVMLDERSSAP
ncbi:MAG: DNA/RNA nuclease SfsA [Aristaeellaceae bacterium]